MTRPSQNEWGLVLSQEWEDFLLITQGKAIHFKIDCGAVKAAKIRMKRNRKNGVASKSNNTP